MESWVKLNYISWMDRRGGKKKGQERRTGEEKRGEQGRRREKRRGEEMWRRKKKEGEESWVKERGEEGRRRKGRREEERAEIGWFEWLVTPSYTAYTYLQWCSFGWF
jgi:hypothetical protein